MSVAADLRESLDEILSEVGIEGVSIDLLLALTAHSTPHSLPPTPLPHSRHLRHSHRAPQVEIVSSLPVPLDAVRNGHNRSSPPRLYRGDFLVRSDGTCLLAIRCAGRPWVVIGLSAVMAGRGEWGLGVYAWGKDVVGEVVGEYDGRICASGASEAEVDAAARDMRSDYVLVCFRGGKWVAIDGTFGGPPYMQFCNSARGSDRVPTLDHVMEAGMPTGVFRVTPLLASLFDMHRPIDANIDSELTLWYSRDLKGSDDDSHLA